MTLTIVTALALAAVVLRLSRRTLSDHADLERAAQPPILPLLALPTLIGLGNFGAVPAAAALAVLAAGALLTRPTPDRTSRWHAPHLVLFLAALAIPLLGNAAPGRLLLSASAMVVVLIVVARWPLTAVLQSLIDGVGVYLIVNVVAYAAGFRSAGAAARTAGLDSTTGGERVFYPLATSLGIPALMAAVFVAAFLISFRAPLWRQLFRLIAFPFAITVLFAANTRIALLISLVVGVAVMLLPRVLARLSVPLTAAILSLAFIYPFVVDPIVRPAVNFIVRTVPFFSRGDAEADVTFAGRDLIWELALKHWSANADLLHALFGWGSEGSRTSGASAAYGPYYLGLTGDPLTLSVHSSLLQLLFDGGVVGLIAYAVAGFLSIRVMTAGIRGGSRAHLIGLAVLLATLWGGATEVSVSPGYAQSPFWVLAVVSLAAARRPVAQQPDTESAPAGDTERPGSSPVPASAHRRAP